jgi:hypothetical protein
VDGWMEWAALGMGWEQEEERWSFCSLSPLLDETCHPPTTPPQKKKKREKEKKKKKRKEERERKEKKKKWVQTLVGALGVELSFFDVAD